MLYVLSGCLSFLPLYLFDRLKLRGAGRLPGLLFLLGCLGIFISTAGAYFSGSPRFILPPWLSILVGSLAIIFALMLLWALFFSLPFERTYVEGTGNAVVDTGLYALCRHPGVLFFCGLYLCVWLVSGRDTMLLCALMLTLSDILHVYVQDRIYFPKTLTGYAAYRTQVPFLIPTAASVRRCIQTLRRKEDRRP